MTDRELIDLLMPAPLPAMIQDALAARFRIHRLYAAADPDALLASVGERVRALATGVPILTQDVKAPVDEAMIARAPNLEIIANLGVGYDNIDVRAAAARGVIVTNTPDVLTDETADTAFGLILNAVRQFSRAERWLRAGEWRHGQFPPSASLRGRTIGILGLGRIGKAIARRAEAFGLRVIYHNRRPDPAVAYEWRPSALDLASACDILVAAVPGGDGTRHVVDAHVLDALGPNGVFINISRGSVVDEAALVAALREKRILTAGLDVFADEPNVPADLIAMDHVALLPHVGSASQPTRDAMCRLVIDNLFAWADGREILTPVAETPWKRATKQANSHRSEEGGAST